ncbi:MAG: glycosylase [Acidobacteria bacterium]|nr:glycosylase [Acidobacteriota bacterium]
MDRVMRIPQHRVEGLVEQLLADFGSRHVDTPAILRTHARAVGSRVAAAGALDDPRALLLGATFTAEYAVEAAALCNPSAVLHVDQSGLGSGEIRVAVALRAIGEGHVSSIEFAEAVIGPGRSWRFLDRAAPLDTARITAGTWDRAHLRSALEHEGRLNELSSSVLGRLPEQLTAEDVEHALIDLPGDLTVHRDSPAELAVLRAMVGSTYEARFDPASRLSQRVLLPSAVEEFQGMEDARFVRFETDDGEEHYQATYTAYDGRDIAPRLIRSADLATFRIHRLTGNGARNKGMALFPRAVAGRHCALTRTDGESISLARSVDGLHWTEEAVIHVPTEAWEVVQTGNCSSPIETDRGWLVLTHGVGPMRTYSLGALLLDLDDPGVVLARTVDPILRPQQRSQDGYVPNVLYSCGAIAHDGILWVPYGIGDARIGVFSLVIDDLLDSLTIGDGRADRSAPAASDAVGSVG